MIKDERNKNILLHQIVSEDGRTSFQEVIPVFSSNPPGAILSIDSSGSLSWNHLLPFPDIPEIPEFHVIVDDKIEGTNIYYKDGRIGISRPPLKNYKFDIAVPENTLMTAFHVGDGKYGFSMGNGTAQGFIPEIIGMGSDENDAGLYFIGKAGNNKTSDIPLIVMDGRNAAHQALVNRPIFGVTNGSYDTYKFLIDQKGRVGIGKKPEIYKMEVEGSVEAQDFIIDGLSMKALIDVISDQQEEIDILNKKIQLLQQK
jgi:hypothetical protein